MRRRPPRGRFICPTCGCRFHRQLWRARHRRRHGKTFRPRHQWVMRRDWLTAEEVQERFGVAVEPQADILAPAQIIWPRP